jgi:hypothetical protein
MDKDSVWCEVCASPHRIRFECLCDASIRVLYTLKPPRFVHGATFGAYLHLIGATFTILFRAVFWLGVVCTKNLLANHVHSWIAALS